MSSLHNVRKYKDTCKYAHTDTHSNSSIICYLDSENKEETQEEEQEGRKQRGKEL